MIPLYEYQDEQTSFKVLIIITGILFFAMAVFLPWPPDATWLHVWGMRALLVLLGAMFIMFMPVLRLRAFTDCLEIRFGPTNMICFRLDNRKITKIEAIEYNPVTEFGGWGIKGGSGKWKGWTAYTTSGSKHALTIETTEKNYLLSCGNPEETAPLLMNIVGLK